MDFARFITRKSVGLSRNSIRSFSIDELKPTAVTLKTAFRDRLDDAKKHALHGGGKKRIDAQHSKGKLTARERLHLLLDEGSFQEYDQLKTHRCTEFGMDKETYYGDGVVTGHGLIHGRKVFNEQLINTCYSVYDARYFRSSFSVRISPSSVDLSARPTLRRSARLWTWPCVLEPQLLA